MTPLRATLNARTVAQDDETVEHFLKRHIALAESSVRSYREWLSDHPTEREMTVAEAVKAGVMEVQV